MKTLSKNINEYLHIWHRHLTDVQVLITKYEPDTICLQEAHLQSYKTVKLKSYDVFFKLSRQLTWQYVILKLQLTLTFSQYGIY